jgi:hypothetical protein
MTCTIIRHRLLASERPDQPCAESARHLANCPSCQAWLRRLVRLERQIPQLHVPTCPPPVALMDRILQSAPVPLVRRPAPPSSDTRRIREGGRQKLALAFSLAATLALFTFAWWAWPPRPPTSAAHTDPYVARVNERLQRAQTPRDRVVVLTDLAEEFVAEARKHVADPQRLARLAHDFDRLVQDDLLAHARTIPIAERAAILGPISDRLRQADSEASRLATAWEANHPRAADHARRIASSASDANRRLGELVRARV